MPSLLEIAANAAITLSIFLAGRNSVHTWWTGIVGCVLFALLFFHTQLYADVTLQVFFIVTSFTGWWQWLRGNNGPPLPTSRAPLRSLAWIVPSGVAAAAGYGMILYTYTDAYAPFADSVILVFSVIAQLLLMRRRLETWIFWFLVNSIAVPLYASRGLYLTSALYAAYWLNAIVSYYLWNRALRRQVGAAVVPAVT